MKKAICGFIYYKLLGWKTKVSVPDYDKYIICAAPHTTNWDLFIGKLFMGAIGRETGFMMKKDWFFWPLGPIFRWMGGIPVDRSRKTSLVDRLKLPNRVKNSIWLSLRKEHAKPIPIGRKGFTILRKGPVCLLFW